MCNPRRIRVSATRQLDEAWQREVSRRVELQARVVGEARVRQNLEGTVGRPALLALEGVLAAPGSGWERVERGFRYGVEGGYVLYATDDQTLEIVATQSDEVRALGEATETLSGQLQTTLEREGEFHYYDDSNITTPAAETQARRVAEQNLESAARAERQRVADEAESAASSQIESEARNRANAQLEQKAQRRQEELSAQAREHLRTVGVRARQVFHRALASAYREALLSYARRNGAEIMHCNEDGESFEIEFRVAR